MKKDKLKWLDVSEFNLKSMVEESSSSLSEGENLLAFVEREKDFIGDKKIKLFTSRAIDLIRIADETKYKMAKLCTEKYPILDEFDGLTYSDDFTKVAGISEDEALARSKKRRSGKSENKSTKMPLDKILTEEIVGMIGAKSGDSHNTILDKTFNKLASGDVKLQSKLVDVMCKSFFEDHPEEKSNIDEVEIKASANRFLDKMLAEYIQKRAEA